MFLLKKPIPRRTFLRAVGVTLGLPFLEAMVPRPIRGQTRTSSPPRFVGIFYPHGMAPGYWVPDQAGPLPAVFPEPSMYILKSLEPVRDHTVVLSGLWSKSAEAPDETTGSAFWVAAAFLTAIKPKRTFGVDINVGSPTIDQTIANAIGQDSLVKSIQLAAEDPNQTSAHCGQGYSCWYTNTISWAAATQPLPMERSPQVVFEQLFGAGVTAAERAARQREHASILDAVLTELSGLKRDLGAADRQTIDRYSEETRNVELRIQREILAAGVAADLKQPDAIPDDYDTHMRLFYDLTALGFQADVTRVATVMGARSYTGRSYPFPKNDLFPNGGTSGSFQGLSRHGENPTIVRNFAGLNRYHVSLMAYFASKLKSIPEGDGTLLDHSLILYGTNVGNSDQTQHFDVPHFLVGGANGKLQGGRHLAYARKTVTTGNLLLAILDRFGVRQDRQGDSTSRLAGL